MSLLFFWHFWLPGKLIIFEPTLNYSPVHISWTSAPRDRKMNKKLKCCQPHILEGFIRTQKSIFFSCTPSLLTTNAIFCWLTRTRRWQNVLWWPNHDFLFLRKSYFLWQLIFRSCFSWSTRSQKHMNRLRYFSSEPALAQWPSRLRRHQKNWLIRVIFKELVLARFRS